MIYEHFPIRPVGAALLRFAALCSAFVFTQRSSGLCRGCCSARLGDCSSEHAPTVAALTLPTLHAPTTHHLGRRRSCCYRRPAATKPTSASAFFGRSHFYFFRLG